MNYVQYIEILSRIAMAKSEVSLAKRLSLEKFLIFSSFLKLCY
jgi:hypothetical protein